MSKITNSDSSKDEIKSFVFLDIETTGLPAQEKTKTRVTELCMISISRDQLMIALGKNIKPRAVEKIVLVMNPEKPITEAASKITGLANYNLETEYPLNVKKATVIKTFLEQCHQPVCLVAHNGFRFDFPILKEEFKNYDNVRPIIPEGTVCADSITAFRGLNKLKEINVVDNGDANQQQRKKRTKFNLNDLYADLFQEKIECNHTAEGDVVALIKCCLKTGKPIIDWFDNNHKTFESVRSQYDRCSHTPLTSQP